MEIKNGDVVQLKSGGAEMVVSSTDFDNDKVLCVWQNATGKGGYEEKQAVYPRHVLVLSGDKETM